jgi:hypothetical protein
MNNKDLRNYVTLNSKEHIDKIKLENGSTIQPLLSENVTRGKGVWATPVSVPDYVELASQTFEDRIEFRAYNKDTRYGEIAPFYFKEGESPAMEHIKQLHIIENLIKKVQ